MTATVTPINAHSKPLLSVRNLQVRFTNASGTVDALRGINFDLGLERLAVVGESGSGKSITFRALLGLLPRHAQIQGAAYLEDQPLLGLEEKAYAALRGCRIGIIVQDPRHGLDPFRTIGAQIAQTLRLQHRLSRKQAQQRTLELLGEVEIREPQRVAALYPHQVSGGMGQRAMIAMVLAAEPQILIADEATSALDSLVRDEILELLNREVQRRNMALVLISHDLDLVKNHADRVLVMYAGRIVESLPANQIEQAQHPYTQGLLASRVQLNLAGQRLPTLQRDAAWLS